MRRASIRDRSIRYALGLAAALLPAACVADSIETTNSKFPATVQSVSALKVVVERSGANQEIPAGQVKSISYDGEPGVLKTVRVYLRAGRYEDAIEALASLNPAELGRQEIVQDIQYYKAYAAAQLALAARGDLNEAIDEMRRFLDANNDSYHFLNAQMLLGDLLSMAGRRQEAQTAYKKVGQMAPWPDYRAQAAVALGRSYLDMNQTAEAAKFFQIALDTSGGTAGVARQKLAATLGMARCLAASGKLEEATKKIQDVIKQADPENAGLLAEAYNALGASYRASDRPKDALLAYLHVDLLYFSSPRDHIEALENLVELWNEQQKPERSSEAARVLRNRYNRTPRL